MNKKRSQYLIDRPVQIGLVARMMVQWACLFLAVVVTLPLVRAIFLGDIHTPLSERLQQSLTEGLILLVVFVLLLPYFAYDSLKMTNRFAGPMYRLHQTFLSHIQGEPYQPIKFRKGDHWQDVATDFNKMMARIEQDAAQETDPVCDNDSQPTLIDAS